MLSLFIEQVWAALLTISYHLQKYLDAGMESHIAQLDFSAAFDIVSHSGLLFKLKSFGVGGIVLFICREFLSIQRPRVVVDVLPVSCFPSFELCHRGVCWVFFCSYYIPSKRLSWWRTDYLIICLCTCLHTIYSGSCSQDSSQICYFCLP